MRNLQRLRSAGLALAVALSPIALARAADPLPAERLATEAERALGLAHARVAQVTTFGDEADEHTALLAVDGTRVALRLAPRSVRAPGFRLLAQGADGSITEVEPEPSATLRGEVVGEAGSRVAGSWLANGLSARIRLASGQEYWLEPLAGRVAGAAARDHVLYGTEDILDVVRTCGVELLAEARPVPFRPPAAGGQQNGTALQTAELACDADFEYYQHWGSAGAVQSRIESVLNAVNLQYESEVAITHEVTTILVRTSSSQPYTSSDAVTLLNQFRNEWNSNQSGIQRDLAQLFTGKSINGGTIGIAWIGVVCNQSYAYSMVESDFNGGFACSTDLSAHEMGHNWNADHCNCTSNTMNPYITCANTFHATFTIPEIEAFRDSRSCLDSGGGDPPGGCTAESTHVASIEPVTVSLGQGNKRGRAIVTVVDDCGDPVAGATVSGAFSGDLNENVSGSTGAGGTVTLDTSGTKKGRFKFTFCVTSVSASPPWSPGDDVESCDSN